MADVSLGTIAVVAVLLLIVGAIVYGMIKKKASKTDSPCNGCSGCYLGTDFEKVIGNEEEHGVRDEDRKSQDTKPPCCH